MPPDGSDAPSTSGRPHSNNPAFSSRLQASLQGAPVVAKELLAGGAAGAIAKTCVAPLERVKILFQTGRMQGLGIGATLARIFETEGVRGLFKGNGASVMRIIPYSALHFGAYEHYRARLVTATGAVPGAVPPYVDLLAGSAAGATAVLATYPLDLVRTRLAYQMEGEGKAGPGSPPPSGSGSPPPPPHHHHHHRRRGASTVRGVLAATVRVEGVRGLYRGAGPTLVGILPYAGLKFYVYQSAKAAHARGAAGGGGGDGGGTAAPPPPPRASALTLLAFGAAAGLVAQTVTYPLDVVRRQMQVQGLAALGAAGGGAPGAAAATAAAASARSAGPPAARLAAPVTSTWSGLTAIARAGGARALFAGVSINYLKVVPSTAIGFTVYDGLKSYLALPHNL